MIPRARPGRAFGKVLVRLRYVGSSKGLIQAEVRQDTPPDTETLLRLLDSIPSMLHPPILASKDPKIMLVLSDLYSLFVVTKQVPAAKKLMFYLAALKQLRREHWLKLEREMLKDVDELRDETIPGMHINEPPAIEIS